MADRLFCVYILASDNRRLYIGVTSDLAGRVHQHRASLAPRAFTSQYRIWKLVYTEFGDHWEAAIAREKELKGWRREKKVALIEAMNPEWLDLAPGIGVADPVPERSAVWLRLRPRGPAS
jgi:putative endonuclease